MEDAWKSVIKNNIGAIEKWLELEPDVNKRITLENNLNLLMVAISEQKHEISQLCLSNPKINVNAIDK